MNMMITFTQMELIRQYDEKKLLFWIICNVLSLLSLINLNQYVISTCQFDLFNWLVKYYYINDE